MICSDALLNLSGHASATTRVVARLMGNMAPGAGWPERLMIRDRGVAGRQADRILAWDFEKIVLAHDHLVERDGRASGLRLVVIQAPGGPVQSSTTRPGTRTM